MTKILLVEDDKELRDIYGTRLQAEGYEVTLAADGEEALAVVVALQPDLIISDIMMPKISGFEMLDLLRSNEATKHIRVIMLTALSSDQQRERGQNLGADRYLVKSQVGIEDMVRIVHEELGDQAPTQAPEAAEVATLVMGEPAAANAAPTAAPMPPNPSPFAPSTPAPNQSPINPPAATAPNVTAGVPQPNLPPTPLSVPAISTPPPMPLPEVPAPVAPPVLPAPPAPSTVPLPDAPAEPVPAPLPPAGSFSGIATVSDNPKVDLTQSTNHAERVIQPIDASSAVVDIDSLVANEEAKEIAPTLGQALDQTQPSALPPAETFPSQTPSSTDPAATPDPTANGGQVAEIQIDPTGALTLDSLPPVPGQDPTAAPQPIEYK